jgi:hypothetical protein
MTECPICETDGYKWRKGCGECGHYDEDRIKLEKKHKREQERRARAMRKKKTLW